jgi:hypothetical protein
LGFKLPFGLSLSSLFELSSLEKHKTTYKIYIIKHVGANVKIKNAAFFNIRN